MSPSVIVWDRKIEPPNETHDVLHWQSYDQGLTGISVPRYLENHAERLRAKYLAFVHDLGDSRVAGRRVVEHLDAGDGFSYWWMTHLSEKSPFKSPRIYDCLRLMALEEILLARRPDAVTLESHDRVLAEAMRALCQNLNVDFDWRQEKKPSQKYSVRSFYDALPTPVQGLISLVRHMLLRWPLRKLRKPEWFSGDDAVFVCSYFFNLNNASCEDGCFYSRQWEEFPQLLRKRGKQTNWIHQLVLNAGAPDRRKGLDWMRRFNQDKGQQGCHVFLDTFLSSGVALRAFKNWLWLNIVRWRLREIKGAFRPKDSAAWLWPLLRRDWQTSISGSTAINNCLWVELFDEALKNMPHQKVGFYLWENQGWETALLHAWHRHGHGQIIGVPHATVAFWHLNNFDDPRNLNSHQDLPKPMPNRLAINGPMARRAFIEAGFPADRLVDVEALRFQYLLNLDVAKARQDSASAKADNVAGCGTRILILGDFTFRQTIKMLRCIEAASLLLDNEVILTLKPHPACEIERQDYPTLRFDLTDRPLAEIMPSFDMAFSSNISSAGLDALLCGLPVVIFLDDENLNHSPLRGLEGVPFVSTGQELATALRSIDRSGSTYVPGDFFWLDSQLPKWDELLSKATLNG